MSSNACSNLEHYAPLLEALYNSPLASWREALSQHLENMFCHPTHGDYPRWNAVLSQLPDITASTRQLDAPAITIGDENDCDADTRQTLENLFKQLMPWRKGPYNIHGVHIDTEWRSDMKWDRIKDHLDSLQGRRVLDIGCGNGYHCWRMAAAGAELVIGIDKSILLALQYLAIHHFAPDVPVYVVPMKFEDLPDDLTGFDTVFSMGVLYHRKQPHHHPAELIKLLRPGGQLILDTLVIDEAEGDLLIPDGRYSKMGNVWGIPSCTSVLGWLEQAGYTDAELLDVSTTTTDEQRVTEWMQFQSLSDFLDPKDPTVTIEGYPAPRRAVFSARR
jgi:tRNA (mo5U34)-methyltransferase